MTPRSILFVPGDNERRINRSADYPADAIILDLEDSVMPARKPDARLMARAALDRRIGARQYWVRINAYDSGEALRDLVAIVGGRPDVILLPKSNGACDVEKLDQHLSVLELREGLPEGGIKVVALATETGAAMFTLGSYTRSCPRLAGLTWGAEDLSAAVGAVSNRDQQGQLTPLYVMARSLTLAAASAAGVDAIDTPDMNFKDIEVLRASCKAARRDGFQGKMAIHPDQVPIINAAFTPGAAEMDEARRIVAAFDASPDVGALQFEGRLIDIPHLRQANRLIAQYERDSA